MTALTIDEILAGADAIGNMAGVSVPSMTQEVRDLVARERAEAAAEATQKAAAHFIYGNMVTTETLFDGSKPVAGQLLDDAITAFLAQLRAELGDGYATHCAASMIRNIALILDERRCRAIHDILEVQGRNR